VDFDFFSAEPFQPETLRAGLRLADGAELLQSTSNTLTFRTAGEPGVRFSFSGGLTVSQIEPPEYCPDHGLPVAGLKDLYAAKLNVVFQRSEAKDYLDIHALLVAGLSLELGLGCARAVFGPSFNVMLPLKALAYFADGDLPLLPVEVRARLLAATQSLREINPVGAWSDRIRAHRIETPGHT
jgi:hypothetical protein